MTSRKDNPIGSPENAKKGKSAMEDAEEVVVVEEMPGWAKAMQQTLMSHTTKTVDGLRVEVDEAKALALQAQEEVRALRKQFEENNAVKAEQNQSKTFRSMEELEEEFKKLRASQGENTDMKRKREMVFKNFPRNTAKKEVEETITSIMTKTRIETEDIFATRPMTSFGLVRFANAENKRQFKNWLQSNKKEVIYKGKELYVEDNRDLEAAKKRTAVGKVVKALYSQRQGQSDITRDYDNGVVYVGTKTVARWKNGAMEFKRDGLQIKEQYDKLMAEHAAKIAQDSDDSL